MNVSAIVTIGLMFVILVVVIGRPMTGGWRGRYCWLNVPYARVADWMSQESKADADLIVAADTRIAGNLKVRNPAVIVLSQDAGQRLEEIGPKDPG